MGGAVLSFSLVPSMTLTEAGADFDIQSIASNG